MEQRFAGRLKNLQKYGFLAVFSKAMGIKHAVYTGYFMDSRGRIYPDSLLHPLHNKALRPLCLPLRGSNAEFNPYIDTGTLAQKLKDSIFYTGLLKHYASVETEDFGSDLSDTDRYIIAVILLELGKLEKTSLISSDGAELQLFLKKGLEVFRKAQNIEYLLALDFEDLSGVLKYSNILCHFLEKRVWLRFSVNKDAPVSAYQH